MIKFYVRAIAATETSYILMGGKDKEGKPTWDLPGGELQAGVDIKQLVQKLVLQNTGYHIVNLKFFEVACKVKPRARGQDPVTIIDFIFTSELDGRTAELAQKEVDLLRFEQFEWLDSGGKFHLNKVMSLLSRYHSKRAATHDKRLSVDVEPGTL